MAAESEKRKIAEEIGRSIDELAKDLYSPILGGVSTTQEPEISSRICQRLEDKIDGLKVGKFKVRASAQSLPDRGPNSFEKKIGADIYVSLSLDGPGGFDKGLLIQSKYDRSVDDRELAEACEKMEKHISKKGNYVWVYSPKGVKVYSNAQIKNCGRGDFASLRGRSISGHLKRVFACYAGDRRWGIRVGSDRREEMRSKLLQARASHGIDISVTS